MYSLLNCEANFVRPNSRLILKGAMNTAAYSRKSIVVVFWSRYTAPTQQLLQGVQVFVSADELVFEVLQVRLRAREDRNDMVVHADDPNKPALDVASFLARGV